MDKMLPAACLVQQLRHHVHKIQQLVPTGRLVNMAMAFLMLSTGMVPVNGTTPGSDLSFFYYDELCPDFGSLATFKFQNLTDAIVEPQIAADPGLAPALMRQKFLNMASPILDRYLETSINQSWFFGYSKGCDASVLLNTTASEKNATVNQTLRGFEVIDAVKAALELVCPGVFSCADILQEVALAAQRYVVQTSLQSNWPLRYGRRDGRVSLEAEATHFLPLPTMNYTQLVANFAAQGLNNSDLVYLSGAHTFGVSRCDAFTQRLYNFSGNGFGTDPALDAKFAANLKVQCPQESPSNIVNLDVTTPSTFDNKYYNNIYDGKVLFTSDDALKSDPIHVIANGASNLLFVGINFAFSFTKMSEINVKLFPDGEIRSNCALLN